MERNSRYCPHCLSPLDAAAERCGVCGGDAGLENEPHQLPVGTLLRDRYRVGRCIGEGGFGITYVGWDSVLAIKVAVKEYYPTGIVNRYHTHSLEVSAGGGERGGQFAEGRRRVLEEARALARFSGDPSIVNVRDTFEANNTAYIVMEFLDGQTLSHLAQAEGPLPFARVYGWLAPVMDALAKIHRQGLIHRDISPSNLMLLKDDSVKLLDFGTMRAFDPSGERSLSVMLKPGFAPEEQYRSHSAQGPWTDVYGMCASIYRLITGVTPENAMNRVFEDTLQPPSALGARIDPAPERALMRGLAVQAADRIQTMEALRRALSGGDEGEEDEERTLYKPRSAKPAPAPVDGPRESVPDYKPQKTAPQAPDFDSPKSAPDDRPRRAAPQPPQYEPRGTAPEAPKAAPGPSDGAKGGARPESRQARPGRKSRRDSSNGSDRRERGKRRLALIIPIAAAGALAVAVALFFVLRGGVGGGNPYRSSGSTSYLRDMTVAGDQLSAIARDEQTTELNISGCQLSDDMVRAIGDMEHIRRLTLLNCSGFTSLDPLSGMASLEALSLSGGTEASGRPLFDLDGLLTADVPRVQRLSLDNCATSDGGAFLSRFPGLERLSVSACQGRLDMENLAGLSRLESLNMTQVEPGGSGFAPLAALGEMTSFSFTDTPVEDISWASGLPGLNSVTLDNCSVTSLHGLEDHAKLYSVSAANNPLEDISGLSGCAALNDLSLAGGSVSDLSVLSGLERLSALSVTDMAVSDLSPLAGCAQLYRLDLSGNPASDLTPLAGCVKLNTLVLNRMRLTNLNGCEAMINLNALEARDNEIESIEGLVNTTQLGTVDLSGNRISDLSPLSKNAEKLTSLFVGGNRVTDLSPVAGASGLKMLGIEGNGLTSLRQLSGFRDLMFLSAADNQISDLSPLRELAALAYLDLGSNQISDMSPLAGHAISDQVLLLQDNAIRDISALTESVSYRCLALYGNPIRDYAPLARLSGSSFDNYLYVGHTDGANLADAGVTGYDTRLVDVPLDRQVPLKEDVNAALAEMGKGSSSPRLTFISAEEADADMEALRAYALENRASLGFGTFLYTALKH
ncbi:MAG: protein kinase [Clostridia bacterium]|nr:protein kinase [Clostridia bacterium]